MPKSPSCAWSSSPDLMLLRLDVAVDDARPGGLPRARRRPGPRSRRRARERQGLHQPRPGPAGQPGPEDVLHHQPVAVDVLDGVEDRHDVRVGDARGDPGLPLGALDVPVGGVPGGAVQLDGDRRARAPRRGRGAQCRRRPCPICRSRVYLPRDHASPFRWTALHARDRGSGSAHTRWDQCGRVVDRTQAALWAQRHDLGGS